ncbi:PilZ domain-containing protein [Alteromonas pelagimontana]|nr:PilZ domain-containing protein [Alteromonas pelagimontana]
MINEPEFNQVLVQLTRDIPREKRFLIKMELKRLARPCMRSIDLRGQVDGECRLYEHAGIPHYLDDIAIEVFEQQLRIFGHFCFGVYEAVLETENNFRVMRDKAAAEAAQAQRKAEEDVTGRALNGYNVPVVNLFSYSIREHERMNFAVAVEVFNENRVSIRGNSVDISIEGMKIKVGKEALFKPGEKLSVYFRGLEDEFAMDKRHGIAYHVMKISRLPDAQHLMLRRAKEFPNAAFDQFLENFIHGNKRRYKVNISNTIDAIRNKMLEQYFSPRSPSLPVFVDTTEQGLIPRYAMTNEVNREILAYWNDENEDLRLGYLINPTRLSWLAEQSTTARVTYVYSFTHLQNEKIYFYSASAQELEQKEELKSLFLGFGSRKASWRVYKLQMADMSPDQAHVPLSIPDSVGVKIKRQNHPPSARLMAKLKNLRHIVHITDITSESGQRQYSSQKFSRNNLPHLRAFGHAKNRIPAEIKVHRVCFQDKRLETRYLLRSNIVVKRNGAAPALSGVSEDISVHGLRIELAQEFLGELDTQVEVAFPKLQEITRTHNVMELKYRVIHHNVERNILHLKAMEGEEGKSARAFFDDLIKQNRSSLKTYPEEEEIPGIGHALRCINARNVPSMAFVLAKENTRYVPQGGIISEFDNNLNRLATHFSEKGNLNVEFMFRDRKMTDAFVQRGIKQVKADNNVLREELFIAYDPSQKESRMAIIPRLDSRFINDENRLNFITEAMNRGQFIALHIMLATTGKPDLEMLQSEINYVSVYAIHRAKELEEKLWSICACAHLIDITDEVLMRYNVPKVDRDRNRELDATYQVELGGIRAMLQA